MTRVVGLDLSLTATGIATADGSTTCIRPKTRGMERLDRLHEAVSMVTSGADIVVMEDYAFSRADAHAHALGELGGIIRFSLWNEKIRYVAVPPTVLKKFTTGKGNANKDATLAAAIRRWGFQGEDNNEADAWLLRAMGLAQYAPSALDRFGPDGTYLLPAYAVEAITKVEWPKLHVRESA